MAVLKILKMGHPILREKSTPVRNFNAIKKLVKDMQDTIEFVGASGLAAPQVQVKKRIVVYRVNENRIPKNAKFTMIPWTIMINPEIQPLSDEKELFWERCLSIPGLHGKVPRFKKISVKYFNLEKKLIEHEAFSTWSALIQHECDHLDGKLYPMRMNDFTKFGYNDSPGDIEKEAKKNKEAIDPIFLDLIKKCPINK